MRRIHRSRCSAPAAPCEALALWPLVVLLLPVVPRSFSSSADVGLVQVGVSDTGEIPLYESQRPAVGAVQLCRVERAAEIREEHATPLQVERDSDALHQSAAQNLRLPIPGRSVHVPAADAVASRRVATVGPVNQPVIEIEIEIDRLGQSVEEHFDVAAVCCVLT